MLKILKMVFVFLMVASIASSSVLASPATTRAQRTSWRSSFTLKASGYNSHVSQTDNSPHITATGARTRFGVVALSRDMLRSIPYGSRVRIEDMGSWHNGRGYGRYNGMLNRTVFVVEDTMHPRMSGRVDVWFYGQRQAMSWGVRRVRLTVLQYGR